MNPIDVTLELRNHYISYLTTSFGVSAEFDELSEKFSSLLRQPGRLINGPFLEATAPYVVGENSLRDLVDKNVLCKISRDCFRLHRHTSPIKMQHKLMLAYSKICPSENNPREREITARDFQFAFTL